MTDMFLDFVVTHLSESQFVAVVDLAPRPRQCFPTCTRGVELRDREAT